MSFRTSDKDEMMTEEEMRKLLAEISELRRRLESGDEGALEKLPSIGGWGNTPDQVISRLTETMERTAKSLAYYNKKVKVTRAALESLEDYSFSPDFAEIQFRDRREMGDDKFAVAEWVYDKIVIWLPWTAHTSNWRYVAYVLNHEMLHGIVGRVLAEDGLGREINHLPHFAGMDDLLGYNHFDISLGGELLSKEVYAEEMQAFGLHVNAHTREWETSE